MAREQPKTVMVVDDDPVLCRIVDTILHKEGYQVEVAHDGAACLQKLADVLPDTVCLDLEMPGLHGLETLERLKALHPFLPVIILTADDKAATAVEAMRRGAYDYLVKPVDRMKLLTTIRNAVALNRLNLRVKGLEREAAEHGYPGVVGRSPAMREIYRQMDRIAASDITVLILGESGAGKEVVAQALHATSGRSKGPFVAVNCAAIPEALLESELFGHERGAFTGAVARHVGKFEQANDGTLFLDEVSELGPPLQAKLLRVIQERKLERVGGKTSIPVDFRLISASQKSLADEVEADRFRKDLYYRIAVFELTVPTLSERKEDIPLLAERFLEELGGEPGAPRPRISSEAMDLLLAHAWPGNVRELKNAIHRAVVVSNGREIRPEDLPDPVRRRPSAPPRRSSAPPQSLHMDSVEKRAIEDALRKSGNNIAQASRLLGIGRSTLYRKMKKYGVVSA